MEAAAIGNVNVSNISDAVQDLRQQINQLRSLPNLTAVCAVV